MAAAQYLDRREIWWQDWPVAQRDHGTACVSCHTVLPYALGRPSLRKALGEQGPSAPERTMLAYITKRVSLWNEVKPFYQDDRDGPGNTPGSRTTEAILNALILARYDAQQGHLSDLTRTAFNAVWPLQFKQGHLSDLTRTAFGEIWPLQLPLGENAGAWNWLNFHGAPWESNESPYWGTTLVALAVGMAPDHYADDPKIQKNVELLRSYLKREYAAQPLVNKIVVLWASARLPGPLTTEERGTLIDAISSKQQKDGGWSLSTLGKWKRHDGTPLDRRSDGCATGLTVLALEEAGAGRNQPLVKRGIAWLLENQNKSEGLWPAYSLNNQRDPASQIGHFMSDAATGYAVLALEKSR